MTKYLYISFFLLLSFWTKGQNALDSLRSNYTQLTEDSLKIKCLQQIAHIWLDMEQIDSSYFYSMKALKLAEQINFKKGKVESYHYLGLIAFFKNDGNESLKFYQQALQISTSNKDYRSIGDLKNAMAEVYLKQKNYNEAFKAYQDAIDSFDVINNLQGIVESTKGIGAVHEAMMNYDKALMYLDGALELERKLEDKNEIASLINRIASIYAKRKNAHSSIAHSKEALKLSREMGNKEEERAACTNLAMCYRALKNYKKSLEYLELSSSVRDSLFNKEKKKVLTNLSTTYEIEKKDTENEHLKEMKKMIEKELKQQQLLNYALGFFLIMVSLSAILFYRMSRERKKANNLLEKQNQEIHDQKSVLEDQAIQIKMTLRELKAAQSQLIQSEKMASLGQLTAGLAHEINNPVNFIYSGITGLSKNLQALLKIVSIYDSMNSSNDFEEKVKKVKALKEEMDYNEVLEDIDALMFGIKEGANRTGDIVKNLQTFSRSDSDKMKRDDVHNILNTTLRLVTNQLGENIKVKKMYDSNLPEIDCYHGQLGQVFMNMLINAIHAIGKDVGLITIETKDMGEKIQIIFRDNGHGIPEEVRSRIFEPFYTTKEVGKGTGLGLAISYGIIENHKGKIQLNSEMGKGTEFIINLPKIKD